MTPPAHTYCSFCTHHPRRICCLFLSSVNCTPGPCNWNRHENGGRCHRFPCGIASHYAASRASPDWRRPSTFSSVICPTFVQPVRTSFASGPRASARWATDFFVGFDGTFCLFVEAWGASGHLTGTGYRIRGVGRGPGDPSKVSEAAPSTQGSSCSVQITPVLAPEKSSVSFAGLWT